jgi:hypothetical protein
MHLLLPDRENCTDQDKTVLDMGTKIRPATCVPAVAGHKLIHPSRFYSPTQFQSGMPSEIIWTRYGVHQCW